MKYALAERWPEVRSERSGDRTSGITSVGSSEDMDVGFDRKKGCVKEITGAVRIVL